ncbi:MAG: hypothetical protein WAW86_09055 [Gammaproteobacteria bacterium]
MPGVKLKSRIKKANPAQHTKIMFGDKSFDLLTHVSAEEKQAIESTFPHLAEESFIEKQTDDKSIRYKVLLGQGTFSKVRIARKKNTDGSFGYYAIRKLISPVLPKKWSNYSYNILDSALNLYFAMIESTLKELQLHEKMRQLNIPNILFIKHYIQTTNTNELPQIYQVMPIAEHGNGLDLLRELACLPAKVNHLQFFENVATRLFNTVCKLHEHKIFHHDIKPSNILFTRSHLPLLCDFGSADYYSDEIFSSIISTSGVSDSAYFLPYAHFNRLTSSLASSDGAHASSSSLAASNEEMKPLYALQDAWALTLTLLQFWHPNVINHLYDILKSSSQFKTLFSDKQPAEIYSFYKNKLNQFFECDEMQDMPKKWQGIFKDIIETSLDLFIFPAEIALKNGFSLRGLTDQYLSSEGFPETKETTITGCTLFGQTTPANTALTRYIDTLKTAKLAAELLTGLNLRSLIATIDEALANPSLNFTLDHATTFLSQAFPSSPYHTTSPAILIKSVAALLKNRGDLQAIEAIKKFSPKLTSSPTSNYTEKP